MQERFDLQNKLAALEENLKSLNQELGAEIESKTTIQLTLASNEKEASALQSRIQSQKELYCTDIETVCRLYLRERETFIDTAMQPQV
jgi:hypothetical protein